MKSTAKEVRALDDRKLKILSAVVDEYIVTGEPVGSKAIMKYVNTSSATIRNEMAELEKQGYLEQPHTSAGRVPTYNGYRLYVDRLVKTNPLSKEEKAMLDGIGAVVFASSLGVGVLFSAGFIIVYQGSITLLAAYIKPFLSETVINEMTCVGSLLIMALGFNMLSITKIKVMDLLPAIFMPILLCRIPGLG